MSRTAGECRAAVFSVLLVASVSAGSARASEDANTAMTDGPAVVGREAAPKAREARPFEARVIAWGPVGVFALAFVDSAGLPIPEGPEAALALVSAHRPDKGYMAAALAVIGAIAGNLLLFLAARKGGQTYLERKCVTPQARRFRAWFHRYGLLTVFIPALVPVPPLPEKVFVLCAGALGVSKRGFLLTLLAARAPRYFAVAYLAAKAGENWGEWFERNAVAMALGAATLFSVLYAAIAIRRRMRIAEASIERR